MANEHHIDVGMFSFNSKGACPHCHGKGIVVTELVFMDPVTTVCEMCEGKRYSEEALSYEYRGHNIADIMELTVEDALEFFNDKPKIFRKLLTLHEVGLSYLSLGQPLSTLSGGERQRVAIARAILKDSPIILLDEALSSLDAENAVAIQKGIEEMIKGKTVFLVSHTLSYIQNSDQILVLSDGILQGCGKHEELLQTVPLYQTMWEKEKSIKSWKL